MVFLGYEAGVSSHSATKPAAAKLVLGLPPQRGQVEMLLLCLLLRLSELLHTDAALWGVWMSHSSEPDWVTLIVPLAILLVNGNPSTIPLAPSTNTHTSSGHTTYSNHRLSFHHPLVWNASLQLSQHNRSLGQMHGVGHIKTWALHRGTEWRAW